MKLILAYPYTDADGKDHDPDSTIEVDDTVGKRLIVEGFARLPENRVSTSKKKED